MNPDNPFMRCLYKRILEVMTVEQFNVIFQLATNDANRADAKRMRERRQIANFAAQRAQRDSQFKKMCDANFIT